nr:MAG TPA: hypothetical protein [Caudoviricetes sp.]
MQRRKRVHAQARGISRPYYNNTGRRRKICR